MSAEEIAMINSFVGNLTRFRFFEDKKFDLPLPNAGPVPIPPPPPVQCGEYLLLFFEAGQCQLKAHVTNAHIY